MTWIAILLFTGCTSEEAEENEVSCTYIGCDSRCIEMDDDTQWEACSDTATVTELCYDEGYQVCELQDDNTCGWTMVDQVSWDECVGS